jgi:hypothetical protein
MNITVIRENYHDKCTLGSLYIDGIFECFTLEDKDRHLESGGQKIPGETAIPKGRYQVIIDYSNRFQEMMPHILSVPDFEGIRIHPGNTDADTHGCILVGQVKSSDSVLSSRLAYAAFLKKLKSAIDRKEYVEITIK